MNREKARILLGVSSNASDDDIKKAYRKLAMQFHPDRNDGDKSAEEKFKQIKQAYEVLTSPVKADEYKPRFTDFGAGPVWTTDDMAEIAKRIHEEQAKASGFSSFSGSSLVVKNIEIPLREAFKGTRRQISFGGAAASFAIEIPAGSSPQEISTAFKQGPLIVQLQANFTDSEYEVDWGDRDPYRRGDIKKPVEVDAFTMMMGGWIEVSTIDGGSVQVRIPEGLAANSLLKIKERGYWRDQSQNKRGDCFLRVIPTIKKLDQVPLHVLEKAHEQISKIISDSAI